MQQGRDQSIYSKICWRARVMKKRRLEGPCRKESGGAGSKAQHARIKQARRELMECRGQTIRGAMGPPGFLPFSG